MNWEYVRLGDVCSKIGSGATPKGGAKVYIDDGTSLIRSQNVYNLEFSYRGLAHITENAAEKLNGVTVQKNDVLINITGDSVARTCIVPDNVLPARVNQHVAIVRPNSNVLNPSFLNYYLASPYMQLFMLGLAVGKGASRNAMTKDMIANFSVLCPPMDIQELIVNKLSVYDNLIKNNKKQIKLLEEAAQRLYREWFVDLRFQDVRTRRLLMEFRRAGHVFRLQQYHLLLQEKKMQILARKTVNIFSLRVHKNQSKHLHIPSTVMLLFLLVMEISM